MSILDIRDRVSTILEKASDHMTVLYVAGKVNRRWIEELTVYSPLSPFWFLDQKKAMERSRQQIWLEDPGLVSALITVKTYNSNVMEPDKYGKVYLRRPSVILVSFMADGSPVRQDLQGQKMTQLKPVKPPVDIDAL